MTPWQAARYREAGKQLAFGPDVPMADAGAEEFYKNSRMKFEAQEVGVWGVGRVCVGVWLDSGLRAGSRQLRRVVSDGEV